MKRHVSISMLVLFVASLLAACGGAATPPAATSETPAAATAAPAAAATDAPEATEAPEATTEATAETEETAEAGATAEADATTSATSAAGAAEELPNVGELDLGTVKIATQSPLSGPQAQFGGNARNGAELALQQLGDEMGFTNLELAPFDDQATPDVGAANANTIAADEDILCVSGHVNSGVALAALPTYQNANLVMISPANTNPAITDDFDGTAYRVVGRDDVQGVVAAEFAQNTLNAQNVYVLHDQTSYGEGLATVFRDTVEAAGITVGGFAGTQETAVFDTVLTPIQAANPDVIFFGGIYDRAGPLIQQARDRGITATFLGGDGLDASDLAALGGEAVVGTNYISVSGPASAYPEAAQFVTDYQAEYNAPAAYPAFQAYDTVKACLLAIANAAIEANGRPTREQVQAAMENVDTFSGVTGTVSFDDKGDRNPATYYVFEVGSGDPAEWGNNEVTEQIEVEPPTE